MLAITTTIPEAIAKVEQMEAVMQMARTAVVVKSAAKAQTLLRYAIEDHTPVGKSRGGSEKHLKDTTEGATEMLGPDAAIVTIRQTKTIPMKDGTPYPLAALLKSGRRGGYLVQPVNKRALFWEGLPHPVMRSHPGPAAPNPYAEEATTQVLPVIYSSIDRIVGDTMRAAVIEGLR